MASHAEVADYVERLAGTDLARRRQLIAERLASGERAPIDGRENDLPRTRTTAGSTFSSDSAVIADVQPRWAKLAFGVGAVALVLAAGLFAWRAFGTGPSGSRSSSVDSASTAIATQPAPSEALEPRTKPTAEPVAVEPAPTATVKSQAHIRPTSRTGGKPPAPSTTAAAAPAAPAPAQPSKPAGMSTVKPPDGIATDNPYKR
jgi:hypothetical protein